MKERLARLLERRERLLERLSMGQNHWTNGNRKYGTRK
jgi:hypothetical protein